MFVFSADGSKKSVAVWAEYVIIFEKSYLALSKNVVGCLILSYHQQNVTIENMVNLWMLQNLSEQPFYIYLNTCEGLFVCFCSSHEDNNAKILKRKMKNAFVNGKETGFAAGNHMFKVNLKGRIHWNFSFKAFHDMQFQGHFMKHKILSRNTFTLVSNIQKQSFRCVL